MNISVIQRVFIQIFSISRVTFHEVLREKILWSSVVFSVLCVGLAYSISKLSFTDNARIALDFGLTSITIVCGLISIIMGSNLIAKEIHNRTLYLVLTKSIWRWQFIIGRVFGLLAVLFLNSFLMVATIMLVYLGSGGVFHGLIFKSLVLQFMELGVLVAVACAFSALSTAPLAAIVTTGIWVIGHAMEDLQIVIKKIDPKWLQSVLDFGSKVLPDLTRFDIKTNVAHQIPVMWDFMAINILYGAAYIIFALIGACLIFSGRDV